ncbi:MAG: dipeptidase [Chloroflexota bacterium]|nr:MAG: dipeptidase [Chloroflexota bacterium]
MAAWNSYLDAHKAPFLDDLKALLRIPSISAIPEHAEDVAAAAEFTAARARAAGLENVVIMPTGGHPVVYADWLHAPGKPTVLIYGHFDVQPVDPLALWETPPFEPTIRDGRMYARGVSDMKAGVLTGIAAVEAMLKTSGALPLNVKYFLEGQEEIGSPQIPAFLAANKARFACDLVISADSGQFDETTPALLLGARGSCGFQIDVVGANSDLHSGLYGGAVTNPLHALVQALASCRGADGRVLVPGFYDEVLPLSAEDRAMIAHVPFDEAEYRAELGVDALWGEVGYTPIERAWARPTLEINGMWGGFQGAGGKTVLPNEAHAKITCRLVPDQDPTVIVDRVIAHIGRNLPPGVRATFDRRGGGAFPYLIPADHPANQVAAEILREIYGKEPVHVRTGGTVPVMTMFKTILGADTLSFAFGLNDERYHAPNEFMRMANIERGPAAYCMLIERLAAKGVR